MKLKVYSSDGSSSQEAEFNQIESFEGTKGLQAVKEVIVAHQANARQGTASTKTRAEVSGGGKKPYRQKGTGNARAGSVTSPLWSGGGVVFGPKPRDYSKKVNKKVKSLALRRIFFDRASKGDIGILESFDLKEAKTAVANRIIRGIAPKGRVLLVEERFSDNAILAARNLRDVDLVESASLNSLALAGYSKIIITRSALDKLVERMNGGSK
jgi:large subunit ribosomal protein L4